MPYRLNEIVMRLLFLSDYHGKIALNGAHIHQRVFDRKEHLQQRHVLPVLIFKIACDVL